MFFSYKIAVAEIPDRRQDRELIPATRFSAFDRFFE